MTNLKKLETLDFYSDEYDDLYIELEEKLDTFCTTILSDVQEIRKMSYEEFQKEVKLIANFLRKYADAIE
jgi:hypothetical protein